MRLVDILSGIEKDTGIRVTEIKTDGGVSRSDLLLQCIANLSNYAVERSEENEIAATGAAYIAGMSAGIWNNFEEIVKLNRKYDSFRPEMDSAKRLKVKKRWEKALRASLSAD